MVNKVHEEGVQLVRVSGVEDPCLVQLAGDDERTEQRTNMWVSVVVVIIFILSFMLIGLIAIFVYLLLL